MGSYSLTFFCQGIARNKTYDDFLQTMLDSTYEDGSVPTEEDIRAEVDTFMVSTQ